MSELEDISALVKVTARLWTGVGVTRVTRRDVNSSLPTWLRARPTEATQAFIFKVMLDIHENLDWQISSQDTEVRDNGRMR